MGSLLWRSLYQFVREDLGRPGRPLRPSLRLSSGTGLGCFLRGLKAVA
jgi:hypothetical protein